MAAAKDPSLERRLKLARLIQHEYQKHPSTLRIFLDLKLLVGELGEIDGIERSLRKIADDLHPDFEFSRVTRGVITSVLDYDLKNLPQALTGYGVVLEDKAALTRYVVDMEQRLREQSDQYQFVLSHPKKHEAALSLEGSNQKPYTMRTGLNRYKLLLRLAKGGMPVSTQDLADFLSTDKKSITADDVRDAVGRIRDAVAKRFKIPRSSIIQNDRSGTGYVIDNIRII